ncbi:hypothetical protein L7F22_016510 [Adiantum nelumboides]|nr:hypothetical protein [Adiantum nelumboides]
MVWDAAVGCDWGSYAFIVPILTIIYSNKMQAIGDQQQRFLHTMRAIQGALIASSTIQIVLGFSGLWGIVVRYISPLGATPLVGLVGVGLYTLGFPGVAKCIEIGLPQIISLLILSQYINYKTKLEQYCILLSVPVIWANAYLLTISGAYTHTHVLTQQHCQTNRTGLVEPAPWLRIPYPLEWGHPTFDAAHTFSMMASVLVVIVEFTGGCLAAMRFASATPPPPFITSRGIGWQGGRSSY